MSQETIAEHYGQLIGLTPPWKVSRVEVSHREEEVRIFVERAPQPALRCPTCDQTCSRYDTRERKWRHLDTMQYRTFLIAEVPRIRCPEHDVLQIAVPWSDPGSRFTALFEILVIDWLREASVSAIARRLRLSWDQVWGIKGRAVKRGLARRDDEPPKQIGVDETSFQKRHEYVSIVHDLEGGKVLHVAEDRTQASLERYFDELGPAACARIEKIAMDMWAPYIAAVREKVPGGEDKLVYDKFHIAQHLGQAVDQVRKHENRELLAEGDDRLKRTKYLWLQNPDRMSRSRWRDFAALRDSRLQVARAWALKEAAMVLWNYTSRGWAERMWKQWYNWAIRSRLEPMRRVARMIKKHWKGVINAATSSVTNARAEAINSRVQWVKRMACGYRNRKNFVHAIYFHLGGLDLYPETLRSTHSKA